MVRKSDERVLRDEITTSLNSQVRIAKRKFVSYALPSVSHVRLMTYSVHKSSRIHLLPRLDINLSLDGLKPIKTGQNSSKHDTMLAVSSCARLQIIAFATISKKKKGYHYGQPAFRASMI